MCERAGAAKRRGSKPRHGWASTVNGAPQLRGGLAAAGLLLIILFSGPVAVLNTHLLVNNSGGSFSALTWAGLRSCLGFSQRAVTLLSCFAVWQALLLVCVPGRAFYGPVTAGGNKPKYFANGVQSYLATLCAFFFCVHRGLVSANELFSLLPTMISTMAVSSAVFCVGLYFKGIHMPTSNDSGSSGSVLCDFYWGTELHPRLLWGRLDIKTYTNSRFGMTSWALLVITAVLAQYERHGVVADSMLVTAALMLLYITKFFAWERGYLSSMDIAVDRAGYMVCWGCCTWVPSVYSAPVLYLVDHPRQLGPAVTAGLLLLGTAGVWINYSADAQRLRVRCAEGARALVWGRPAQVITAPYVTATGERKVSLLLCSGWWGVAVRCCRAHLDSPPPSCADPFHFPSPLLQRHFHYIPE
jgi:7-dehydrocholesterol reductase